MGSTVVNAGGFLVPGPVGTPGMMTVAGDLTIQRNAFYVVQVNPRTASSINVSGNASLDGNVAAPAGVELVAGEERGWRGGRGRRAGPAA